MLVIRNDQMNVFAEDIARRFEREMLRHLRDRFPGETGGIDESGLLEFVRNGITMALRNAIDVEDDIMVFLEYLVRFGSDFEINPELRWMVDILKEPVSGKLKIEHLKQHHGL